MTLKRALLIPVVLIAALLALFVLFALAVQAAPACTCNGYTVIDNADGSHTIVVTATGASWYRIIDQSGNVFAGPQHGNIFNGLRFGGNATYRIQVAQAYGGPWSGSAVCTIHTDPTTVTIESIAAVPNVSDMTIVGLCAMSLCFALVIAWWRSMARRHV